MFENVLFQTEIVSRLSDDIASGRMPPAVLFSGPEYSGKGTAALEVARALSCKQGDAVWNCQCRRCEHHRLLIETDSLLMGWRSFMQEIKASANALERTRSIPAQYLFNRAVRKLTRRFDPVLWEGEEAKLGKSSRALESIGEELEILGPGSELPPADKLSARLESVCKLCSSLAEAVPASVPINQVRRASAWARITPPGRKRTVIVENADLMQESARNALLKLLEEPPESTALILTTARRSAIIATILSRLRTYHFAPRNEEASKAVMERIFRDEEGRFSSLKDFFQSFYEVRPERFAELASSFVDGVCAQASRSKRLPAVFATRAASWLNSALAGSDPITVALSEGRAFADAEGFSLFLSKLADAGEGMLRGQTADGEALIALTRWKKLIDEARYDAELLRMSPSLVAQGLFYRMRSVLEKQ